MSACKSTDTNRVIKAIVSDNPDKALEQIAKQKQREYQKNPELFVRDIKGIKALFDQLSNNAGKVWGENDAELPSNKRFCEI